MGAPCNTIRQYNLKIVWKYHIGTDQGTTTSCVIRLQQIQVWGTLYYKLQSNTILQQKVCNHYTTSNYIALHCNSRQEWATLHYNSSNQAHCITSHYIAMVVGNGRHYNALQYITLQWQWVMGASPPSLPSQQTNVIP